jgi:hypothetical protein
MRTQRSAEPQRWALFRNRFAVNPSANTRAVLTSTFDFLWKPHAIANYLMMS